MNLLRQGDILRCLGGHAYSHGKNYWEDGRVTSLEVDLLSATKAVLSTTVLGSRQSPYHQRITINKHPSLLEIIGACSCPVSFNCKHVAAACLQFVANGQAHSTESLKESACLTWLESFALTNSDSPAPNPEFVIYCLNSSKSPGKLQVSFQITRHLKSGSLGIGRNLNLSTLLDSYPAPKYAQPIDREIGQLLRASMGHRWYDLTIEGELGYLALYKMVSSGRSFWLGTTQPPLTLGERRKLQVVWQEDGEGNAKLAINIDPQGVLLLTDPPLYLDTTRYVIGPLNDAPYTPQQLEKLLQAPIVPKRVVGEFSHKLIHHAAPLPLPPSSEIAVTEINGEQPTPCVQLFLRGHEGAYQRLIRIRFCYGPQEIAALPPTATTVLREGGNIIRIERQLATEHAAIDHLRSFGFEALLEQRGSAIAPALPYYTPSMALNDLIFAPLGSPNPLEAIALWQQFLATTVPLLQQQGWRIAVDDNFQMIFHQADVVDAAIEESDNDWFGLRFDVEIDGQSQPLLPLVAQIIEHYTPAQLPETLTVELKAGHYLTVQRDQIRPIIETLYELYDHESLQNDGSLRLTRFDAGRLAELDINSTNNLRWRGGTALRQLGQKLQNFQGIEAIPQPEGLNAVLRPYQLQGYHWLQFLREYGFAGILADDMGLGKTVQTLTHLLQEKQQGRLDKPALIVAPTSLMSNWRREAAHFTPALKVLVLQGPDRHEHFAAIDNHDIVLSTYPLLVRDEETLLARRYALLVLDEAQIIKNPRAKAAQIVRGIKTDQRLCLTGTPMENHLGELWALFDFLMPGFLGDNRQFTSLFRTPIEKHGDNERRHRLAKRIAPFMLRRTKREVATELPEKNEIIHTVTLDKKQAALYESVRLSMEKKVRAAISSKGLARSHITILDALLKLRQVCCDPRLLSIKQAQNVNESAKLELLMQLLPEMIAEGRRILLFSQFTEMLALIEIELHKLAIPYSLLTGQTRKRDVAIESFKRGETPIFLISLKAGGVGLNLTEADTVIHYDPWWNPAAENQASDRAHRIGQDKTVFVYKLVTENSVEEKIVAMQTRKQALAQGIYNQNEQGGDLKLTADDLHDLLAPL